MFHLADGTKVQVSTLSRKINIPLSFNMGIENEVARKEYRDRKGKKK